VGGKSPDMNKHGFFYAKKSSEQFRWPKATSLPQELDVWGPEQGPTKYFLSAHQVFKNINCLPERVNLVY
jgi:hypothetical protein